MRSPIHSEIIFRKAKRAELWLVPHGGTHGSLRRLNPEILVARA